MHYPNEEKEPVIRKIDTFLGLTKFQFVSVCALIALVMIALFGAIALIRINNNQNEIDRSKKALTYICKTTNVLDDVVVAAANQSEENFKNGTYTNLRKRGVITDANIKAARQALMNYRKAHLLLQQNKDCRNVNGNAN